MVPLPKSGLPAPTSSAVAISGDGSVWAGNEDPLGINTYRAVVGINTNVLVLDSLGNVYSQAINISHDGTAVVGKIGQQAAFWSGTNYAVTLVTSNGVALFGEALGADGGWVVGKGGNFGWIAAVTNGAAQSASAWLAQHYGLTVTHTITAARDMVVVDGHRYIAFDTTVGAALFVADDPLPPPALTIQWFAPGQVQLRWPTNRSCAVESASAVPAPLAWTSVTNPAPVLSNSQWTLTLPATGTAQFFRLTRLPLLEQGFDFFRGLCARRGAGLLGFPSIPCQNRV